ncbi:MULTISPECIES: TRAP transporter small permease [Thalassospira]|uniref:TRAP transporter small permease n=1 Tax=Thalassospira TaxID=168934 RepID=UPI001CBD44E1|nr:MULTISPECIES: TRAP transporter small permease subunit [Thalassospira]
MVGYAIIVVSFVGISIGIRLGSHISVDLLDAFVPEKYVPALHAIAMALGIIFAIALIYYGGKLFLPPWARSVIPASYSMIRRLILSLLTALRTELIEGKSRALTPPFP